MSDRKSQRKRNHSTSSDSSVDSAENERRKDLQERDEFANRLRKKDEGNTRKVTEVSDISDWRRYTESAAKVLQYRSQFV